MDDDLLKLYWKQLWATKIAENIKVFLWVCHHKSLPDENMCKLSQLTLCEVGQLIGKCMRILLLVGPSKHESTERQNGVVFNQEGMHRERKRDRQNFTQLWLNKTVTLLIP